MTEPYGPGPEQPGYPPPPPGQESQFGAQGAPGPGYQQYSGPPGMYHDPVSGLPLPNGTELASVGRRIGAYFLSILLAIVTLGIGYIIWGLIVWGRGQTPALQVLKMRCWRPESAQAATWGWMALREIIGRLADNILGIITGLISFILMVATPERRTLHDLIAGTVVLHDPGKVLG